MKISIIIPVYNAEKYLDECILSVCNQSFRNLEIILVDDGSKDNSLEICKRWAAEDDRILVIHKENGGVSSARNSGLDAATGDYITFLDSDDYLELDILQKAAETIENQDVIHCLYKFGFSIVKGEQRSRGPELYCDNITREELLSYAIYPNSKKYMLGNFFRAVCGSLFNAKILRDEAIKFPENIYLGEDALFIMEYLKYVETAKVVDSKGYNYRMLETSAVHRYKSDLYVQSQRQAELIIQLVEDMGLKDNTDIIQSISLLYWRVFTVLAKNGTAGWRKGRFEKSRRNEEAKKWYFEHLGEMRSAIIQSAIMAPKTKLLYHMSHFCPAEVLCWIANL